MTAAARSAPPHWIPVYVGLGSNLDSPADQVRAAFAELARLDGTRLVLQSPLYRSAPMGPPDQPDYVNAVAGLLATCAPEALLAGLQAVEKRLGRQAGVRWGPRIIDLDILVFGDRCVEQPGLTLPHPGIAERAFVLQPLADIAPDLGVPGLGTVRQLLQRIDATAVQRLADPSA